MDEPKKRYVPNDHLPSDVACEDSSELYNPAQRAPTAKDKKCSEKYQPKLTKE